MDLLFEAPEPRNIASRPVRWIAATMAEGAAIRDISNMLDDITKDIISRKMLSTCAFYRN